MNDAQAARLGRLFAHARRNKNLPLRAVAEQADIDYSWLARLERGVYSHPAPERLTRLAEVLNIDPERIDRITKGHVANSLPAMRTYFRSKYDFTPSEIDVIERTVTELQRNHERRDANEPSDRQT